MQPLGTSHATSHAMYGDFLIQINAYPKPLDFILITRNVNLADIQQWEKKSQENNWTI